MKITRENSVKNISDFFQIAYLHIGDLLCVLFFFGLWKIRLPKRPVPRSAGVPGIIGCLLDGIRYSA